MKSKKLLAILFVVMLVCSINVGALAYSQKTGTFWYSDQQKTVTVTFINESDPFLEIIFEKEWIGPLPPPVDIDGWWHVSFAVYNKNDDNTKITYYTATTDVHGQTTYTPASNVYVLSGTAGEMSKTGTSIFVPALDATGTAIEYIAEETVAYPGFKCVAIQINGVDAVVP